MEDYPSNQSTTPEKVVKRNATPSNAAGTPAQSEDPAVKPIVTEGQAVKRKKSVGRRIKETIIGGDARGVYEYVMLDVLVPAAKEAVTDAVTSGIERMIFGDSAPRSRRGRGGGYGGGGTAYHRGTPSRHREDPRAPSRRASRNEHDFDGVIIDSRVEANEVLESLYDLLQRFDQVTVADLYNLAGISSNHVDLKWGWTDLRGSDIRRVSEGYLINLPRLEPLD